MGGTRNGDHVGGHGRCPELRESKPGLQEQDCPEKRRADARQQLEIVLEPRNAENYPNIKARFLKEIDLRDTPSYKEVKSDKKQYAWWIKNISAQAGKSGGFAHVGGNAQDLEVVKLKKQEREAFETHLAAAGFLVLYEFVAGEISRFKGVSLAKATTFHVYKGSAPRLIA